MDKAFKGSGDTKMMTELTFKQKEALEYLANVRHQMHSRKKAFFLSDDPKHSTFELFLGKDGDGIINKILQEAGLPTIDIDRDIFKVPTDRCFKREDYMSDYDFEISRALAFDRSDDIAEKINSQIEEYLGKIDQQFGTRYKPSGYKRFYKPDHVQLVQKKFAGQAYIRADQAIKTTLATLIQKGYTPYDCYSKIQQYIDKHYPHDLFVITTCPPGLVKPPKEVMKHYGVTYENLRILYNDIEMHVPDLIKSPEKERPATVSVEIDWT